MIHCPFCGAGETERLRLNGRTLIIFPCMFSPFVDSSLSEAELENHLQEKYGKKGDKWFETKCEQLHLSLATGK